MQIYKGKEYMERDLHVTDENGGQDVLRIMDEDFESLHKKDKQPPKDWAQVHATVEVYLPLEQIMLTSNEDVLLIINEKNGRSYTLRDLNPKRKPYINPSNN
jgi:hypothetical protein